MGRKKDESKDKKEESKEELLPIRRTRNLEPAFMGWAS